MAVGASFLQWHPFAAHPPLGVCCACHVCVAIYCNAPSFVSQVCLALLRDDHEEYRVSKALRRHCTRRRPLKREGCSDRGDAAIADTAPAACGAGPLPPMGYWKIRAPILAADAARAFCVKLFFQGRCISRPAFSDGILENSGTQHWQRVPLGRLCKSSDHLGLGAFSLGSPAVYALSLYRTPHHPQCLTLLANVKRIR